MFEWSGGSRQLSQGCTLQPFNVDRGTGDLRGKFDVYERACLPREGKNLNVWHIIFLRGGGGGAAGPF